MNSGHKDVVIVGGGLVGLSLGCSLANSDYSVLIVDAGGVPQATKSNQLDLPAREGYHLISGFSPRVSAISNRSYRFLKHIDAWDKIPDNQLCPYHRMVIWDARGTGETEFVDEQSEKDQGYIVENINLQYALWQTANNASNLELSYGHTVHEIKAKDIRHDVYLDNGDFYEADLVVGADGANSLVASYAGLTKREWSYDQHAFVTVVETEKSHEWTAWQCFTPLGPLAFLPLNADTPNYCSIVWSMNPEHLSKIMELDDQALAEELTRHLEARLGRVTGVDTRHSFPLIQRHARKYFVPGLTLIGDAAHTLHPLAGQGVNLGFSDARTLGKLLGHAKPNQADSGYEKLLRKYQRRRQPENLAMMALMESFKRLYEVDDPSVNWLRNSGMKLLQKMPSVKHQIIKMVGGD